jgi:hypothetical protein
MQTDRELLQAAARAAGLEYNGGWFDSQSGLLVWEPPTTYESREWNPLTDDGDALRLAVTLQIDFAWDAFEGQEVMAVKEDEWFVEPYGTDKYSATRRAIVRAAAAIAK